MIDTEFDLEAWAERGGFELIRDSGNDRWIARDQEIGFYVAEEESTFAFQTTSRNGPRVLEGRFADELSARKLLIALIGVEVRSRLGLPRVRLGPELPSDGDVIRCRDGEFPATITGQLRARLYDRIGAATPEQIAEAYRSPTGAPLFS